MESNEKLEQLLRQMYAQETPHDDDTGTSDIVDEEWTKFEAKHFGREKGKVKREKGKVKREKGKVKREKGRERPLFLKIAAMFVGVLMLSGIAFAAIHLMTSRETGGRSQEDMALVDAQLSTDASRQAEQDSTATKPVVYENTELAVILDDIATFYQVEPVYKKETTKHVRLYFTWNKKLSIDDVVGMFNKFERFHITRYDKILIVE